MEEQINLDEIPSIEISTDAIAAVQEQRITPLDFYIYCFVNLLDTAGLSTDEVINRKDFKESVDRLFKEGLFYEENSNEDNLEIQSS